MGLGDRNKVMLRKTEHHFILVADHNEIYLAGLRLRLRLRLLRAARRRGRGGEGERERESDRDLARGARFFSPRLGSTSAATEGFVFSSTGSDRQRL
jgi:hypothetical protein